jgi:hypothetical protein
MFKPPKPTPFTGEKRDSEAVASFLYQVKIYCRASGITADDNMLDVAALLLSSKASSWFQLNESTFASKFSIFEEKFRANFTPPQRENGPYAPLPNHEASQGYLRRRFRARIPQRG